MPQNKTTPAHHEHVILGMIAAMGAFFMFTVMNMFAKLLSANHSVIEIAFYRNLIACLPFLIMIFAFGRREILVIRSKPSLVGVRAAIGTVSLITTFAAYSLMPMADTTALLFTAFRNAKAAVVTVFNYSSIVWATLFGWMIWNEWPVPRDSRCGCCNRFEYPDDLARESPG
jgi:drug/metabolite transporter (DMT)-like permease